MRTTVELADDLIAMLHALAVKKGHRGYSKIMEEAAKLYLRDQEKNTRDIVVLLNMRGSWRSGDALKTRERLAELRKNWKA